MKWRKDIYRTTDFQLLLLAIIHFTQHLELLLSKFSAYEWPLTSPDAFDRLIDSVLDVIGKRKGINIQIYI